MKPKLIIVLALIVIAPLAVTGWLGARIVRDEQLVVRHRFQELMLSQLRAVEAVMVRSMETHRQAVLGEMTPLVTETDELRRRTRESPYVLQYYLLDADGALLYPPVREPSELTDRERDSLQRTQQIWDGGALFAGNEAADSQSTTMQIGKAAPEPATSGWYTWYWGEGLQWMLWKREAGYIQAAELNRTRLLAELIASLPDTGVLAPELSDGRIRLVDSTGEVLYQWGAYEAENNARPVAAVTLGAPLGAWSFEYHAPEEVFGSAVTGGFLLNLLAALAIVAAAVIGLTYYFYREQSRELREAAQRVSFVNQVSHELKTPLTNIRLYAELLGNSVDEDDERTRRHLDVIVSESQRLSRLIGNVLTFSRKQRRVLELHRRPGVVDEVLRGVLDHFRPALEASGIDVEFSPGAGQPVSFDTDAVEQIVGNLISNVEKYGASGKLLALSSRQSDATVEITVADRGPGLSGRDRQRIFRPFYRVSNAHTDGVAGTGIGLTISRDLARLHGGDLELEPSEKGARFRVTLHCPPAAEEG